MHKFIKLTLIISSIYANFLFANVPQIIPNGDCAVFNRYKEINYDSNQVADQIQQCLDHSSKPKNIVIHNVSFAPLISINQTITINRDVGIFTYSESDYPEAEFKQGFIINAQNVSLSDLKISRSTSPAIEVKATNGGEYQFANLKVTSSGAGDGISVDTAKRVSLINTKIQAGQIPFKVKKADFVKVQESTLEATSLNVGLKLGEKTLFENHKVKNVDISYSTINGRIAVELNSDDILIQKSTIEGVVDGVGVHQANSIIISNSNITARSGGIGMNGTITAAINLKDVADVKILGTIIQGTTDFNAVGSRAIELGEGTTKALINQSCLNGGNHNIGISNKNSKTINIKNSNFTNWHRGGIFKGYAIAFENNAIITATQSCFNSDEALKNKGLSTFNGNFWKDENDKKNDTSPLTECPKENDCKIKVSLVYDFRFDVCNYDKDKKVENFADYENGIARNLNVENQGMVCQASKFDKNSTQETQTPTNFSKDMTLSRIKVNQISNQLSKDASLLFWVKTTLKGKRWGGLPKWAGPYLQPALFGKDGPGINDIFWGWFGPQGKIGFAIGNVRDFQSKKPISDNKWHHVAFTRNAITNEVKIYIDGVFNKKRKFNKNNRPTIRYTEMGWNETSVYDAKRFKNVGIDSTRQFFGDLDELKIYDGVIDENKIQEIYNNEKQGKSYDGTTRKCPVCIVFDAADPNIDTSIRDIADKEKDKIFSLRVFPQKSKDDRSLILYTGSVCAYIVDANTGKMISERKYEKQVNNKYFETIGFKGVKATPSARIKMIYSSELGLSCSELEANNDGISYSSDDFAIIEKKNYKFDAWDTFRDMNDRNISTKIINKEFSINLHTLNETNTALQNYKGTICAGVYDNANLISQQQKVFFNDINTSEVKFSVQKASKNARVKIFWIDEKDVNCPAANSLSQTFSSDNFAIRPNKFQITAPSDITSGKEFALAFQALDIANNKSSAYDETENTSFRVDYNFTKAGCVLGSFTPSIKGFSFTNGEKILNTKYSEISKLDINISDEKLPCDDKFAKVDCKDKNISSHFSTDDISIGTANLQIEPKVAKFDANLSLKNFENGKFTYFANPATEDTSMKMRAKLKAKLKALNDEGAELLNFDKNCSAIDGNLSLSPKTPFPLSITIDDNITRVHNTNLNINKNHFTEGKAEIDYKINFARMYNKPINPYFLEFDTSTKVKFGTISINQKQDGNATFYYGKIKAYDTQTFAKDINSPVEIEVYDKTRGAHTKNLGFKENSLYWFRNLYDTNLSSGKVISANDTNISKPLTFSGEKLEVTPENKTIAGTQDLKIKVKNTSKIQERTLHINNTKWLWNGIDPYSYASGSTCKEHICIKFSFQKVMANPTNATNPKQWLESGEIKGSDLDVENLQQNPTNTTRDRGVKVFR